MSERFSEDDLLKKGFVRDGAGVFVPAQKRIALTHGSARVDENVSPETVKMLNKLSEKAFLETDKRFDEVINNMNQQEKKEKFNPKNNLFAKGRLKKGVMNKTESSYARYLDALKFAGEITWYAFEKIKLMLADNTSITIDFAILYPDGRFVFHDVKGARILFQDDAKAKMKIACEMFPFEFFVVFPRKQKLGGGDWDIEQINPDKNK